MIHFIRPYYRIIFYLPIIILIFNGCKEDSPSQITDNSFAVNILVVDSVGKPMPDFNVSIWAKPDGLTFPKISPIVNALSSTNIRFTVRQPAWIEMEMYDLNSIKKDVPLRAKLFAGNYVVTWSNAAHNSVHKCLLSAYPDSLKQSLLFRDSIYVVDISPDPSLAVVGKTDAKGRVTLKEKTIFPHFYNLPLISRTSEQSPEEIGKFKFTSKYIIAVTNKNTLRTIFTD